MLSIQKQFKKINELEPWSIFLISDFTINWKYDTIKKVLFRLENVVCIVRIINDIYLASWYSKLTIVLNVEK